MGSSSQNTQTQSNSTTNYNQSTNPNAPQQAVLNQILQGTSGALTAADNVPLPADFTATMTPQQLAIFNQMASAGVNLANPATGAAMAGGSTAPYAFNNAESALTNLNGFDPTKYTNAGSVLGTAQQYVNGVNIPAQVKNAMQSATEEARDVTNPGIVNSAASNNNVDSSRTDLAQGLVDRALAEQAGNLSGTLQNQAWNTGTGLGTSLATANQTANLDALVAALSGGTSLGTAGSNAVNTGVNAASNAFNLGATGATGAQENNQLGLTNALQQYLYGTQSPFVGLDQAFPLVNSQVYGTNTAGTSNTNSNSNSTTTTNPSAFQVIGGLMGAAGSMLGGTGLGVGGGGSSGVLGLLQMLKPTPTAVA